MQPAAVLTGMPDGQAKQLAPAPAPPNLPPLPAERAPPLHNGTSCSHSGWCVASAARVDRRHAHSSWGNGSLHVQLTTRVPLAAAGARRAGLSATSQRSAPATSNFCMCAIKCACHSGSARSQRILRRAALGSRKRSRDSPGGVASSRTPCSIVKLLQASRTTSEL